MAGVVNVYGYVVPSVIYVLGWSGLHNFLKMLGPGAYLGGGTLRHVPPPLSAEVALLPRSAPCMEKVFPGYCALTKCQKKFFIEAVSKKG